MPLEESLAIELLEEPEVTLGDKWRNFKQSLLTSLQYSALLVSYVPFILWIILVGPSRQDPVFRFFVDMLPILGGVLFLASIVVVSSQTFLLNQIKGAGKDVIDAEIIYPNGDYGYPINNVIMYYTDIVNEPELFKTIIQDYNRRKRIIDYGELEADVDDEIVYDNGKIALGSPQVEEKRYRSFRQWFGLKMFRKSKVEDVDEMSVHVLKCESCNIIKGMPKHHDDYMILKENDGGRYFECADHACSYRIDYPKCTSCNEDMMITRRGDAFIVYTRSGMPLFVSETSHPDIYEKIIRQIDEGDDYILSENDEKEVRAFDFRSYMKDYDVFSPVLLDSGFWKLLLLRFKIGYWVGNSYTKSMFLLSREDSLDKLFLSTRRSIQLEGVFGESMAYHTILVLIGFWRNIPICLPVHTKEKIDLVFNRNSRYHEIQPHIHKFDKETGLCTAEILNEKGGRTVCGRSLESFIREWYYQETSPTDEEIIGAQHRTELSMLKNYFIIARDYEIKYREQTILNDQLLDRGTGIDVEFLEVDKLLAREKEGIIDRSPTWLFIIGSAVIGYILGYTRFLKIGG